MGLWMVGRHLCDVLKHKHVKAMESKTMHIILNKGKYMEFMHEDDDCKKIEIVDERLAHWSK